MNKSPGHQKMPNHKVEEERVPETMKVEVDGETIAQSADVILVKEDDHPDRYYFPRNDVQMKKLERTVTTTDCPFKGTAHYFNINTNGRRLNNAVWTYQLGRRLGTEGHQRSHRLRLQRTLVQAPKPVSRARDW